MRALIEIQKEISRLQVRADKLKIYSVVSMAERQLAPLERDL